MTITVALFQQPLAGLRAYRPGRRRAFFLYRQVCEDITICLFTFGWILLVRRTSQRWDFRSRLASWYHGFSRARATLDVFVLCAGNLGSLAILLPAQQQYFENNWLWAKSHLLK